MPVTARYVVLFSNLDKLSCQKCLAFELSAICDQNLGKGGWWLHVQAVRGHRQSKSASAGEVHSVASADEKPISLFQESVRDQSTDGDGVCSVSAAASPGRGYAFRY